jgi:hypothetical protein
MKKVVIAGSASLQDKMQSWKKVWEKNGFDVIAHPQMIAPEMFLETYPDIYADFFKKMTEMDIFFLMNEDKNGVEGYIGAASFGELCFAVSQKVAFERNIDIVIQKMPSRSVSSYEEVSLWLSLGWIRLFEG